MLTSQLVFLASIKATVCAQTLYNKHGSNTSMKRNAADMVFSETPDTLALAIFHVVPNAATGGYAGSYTIGLPGVA